MTIVTSPDPVTLVGPTEIGIMDLETALMHAPLLAATDGGAARALAAGHDPVAVFGDMDSLPEDLQARLKARLHRIEEQDTTDFDKSLRSIDAPLILAVGFAGGRQDHELAVMSSLCARPDRRCIIVGPETIVFHCPRELDLMLGAGALVSLFPMLPVTVAMSGLRWSFDSLELRPGGRIGTSNEATGGPIEIRPSADGLLVILSRADLDAAIAALTGD